MLGKTVVPNTVTCASAKFRVIFPRIHPTCLGRSDLPDISHLNVLREADGVERMFVFLDGRLSGYA